jgi:hypothetical protein
MIQGKCQECGTKKSQFISKKQQSGEGVISDLAKDLATGFVKDEFNNVVNKDVISSGIRVARDEGYIGNRDLSKYGINKKMQTSLSNVLLDYYNP